jgi:hypothetical protein
MVVQESGTGKTPAMEVATEAVAEMQKVFDKKRCPRVGHGRPFFISPPFYISADASSQEHLLLVESLLL